MHPRNPYRNGIDFASLSDIYAPLRSYLIPEPNSTRKTIDFKDPNAQRRLTEAIMLRDFGVKLHVPEDRLCPPVPNRVNYILWIQDLIRANEDVLGSGSTKHVRGIDIGTGSTAIYALLGCKMDPSWSMVATEIDDLSYSSARRNIDANDLAPRIDLRRATSLARGGKILFPLEQDATTTYHFTLCNPPFYASAAEITALAEGKERPPRAVCTGAEVEMIYEAPSRSVGETMGREDEDEDTWSGEAGFVGRMVRESVTFGTRCRWYTSLLGLRSSVQRIVSLFKKYRIDNYAVTEFVQGQTRRWGVGWSFGEARVGDDIARISPTIGPSHPLYSLLAPRNTLTIPVPVTDADTNTGEGAAQSALKERESKERERRVTQILGEVLDAVGDARVTRVSLPPSPRKPRHFSPPPPVSAPRPGAVPDIPAAESPGAPLALSCTPAPATATEIKTETESEQSRVEAKEPLALFYVEAMRNTWSRGARRRAKAQKATGEEPAGVEEVMGPSAAAATSASATTSGTAPVTGPALCCSVRLLRAVSPETIAGRAAENPAKARDRELDLEFQWVYGRDRPLFEGFVSHVGRKVAAARS